MHHIIKIILIMASTLLTTNALATGGGGGICSDFPLFHGGLACNLYCGDGYYARKLNCSGQREGDPNKYCDDIKTLFEKRTPDGATLPCEGFCQAEADIDSDGTIDITITGPNGEDSDETTCAEIEMDPTAFEQWVDDAIEVTGATCSASEIIEPIVEACENLPPVDCSVTQMFGQTQFGPMTLIVNADGLVAPIETPFTCQTFSDAGFAQTVTAWETNILPGIQNNGGDIEGCDATTLAEETFSICGIPLP